jgi:hypothetical protein
MQYLGRVVGIAALALGTTALSGCYAPGAPPPVATVTPDQTSTPYPPPAYPPAATETPTPGYPSAAAETPTPAYPPPAYPPTAAETPTPGYPPAAADTPTPGYPPPAYPPPAAGPTPLTPSGSGYGAPQYGSTAAPALAPSGAGTMSGLVAPYAPPPARAENPPPSSSPLAMWQPGHWSWNGSQYVWMAGHYVERPSSSANWIPGYWQQGAGGWTWVDGRWTS